ncbi:hypothetical protein [EBPR siphovirus 2]|nr:hypothetical protein [EBPR siphovirus 2]
MTTPENANLRRSALVSLLLIALGGYGFIASLIGSRVAIEVFNVIMLALASAGAVAYGAAVIRDLCEAHLDRLAVLAVGIFSGCFWIAYRTGASVIWRFADKPVEWLDSAWWGLHLPGTCFALMCHLIAPKVLGGRVPSKAAVRLGGVVAVAVFVGAGLAVLNSGYPLFGAEHGLTGQRGAVPSPVLPRRRLVRVRDRRDPATARASHVALVSSANRYRNALLASGG